MRDSARDRRVRAIPAEELYARQRGRRSVRRWRDELGMVCFRGALTPEVGVTFVNRLDAETDRVRRAARRGDGGDGGDGGEREDRSVYAADAFVGMVSGHGKGRGVRADVVVVVCDLRAYRRGHTHDGEPCHIIGGGSIPVAVAREMAKDAFLKVAFHDGVEITSVAHLGRHRPAELRTALELGAPPDFA